MADHRNVPGELGEAPAGVLRVAHDFREVLAELLQQHGITVVAAERAGIEEFRTATYRLTQESGVDDYDEVLTQIGQELLATASKDRTYVLSLILGSEGGGRVYLAASLSAPPADI